MTNNEFQQHLKDSRYSKLLSEDSQFYSDDYNFTFAFQPTDPYEPEMVEAERLDLAARFDAFAGQWAKKFVDNYLRGTYINPDSSIIEDFDESLFQEFSEKIFVVFLATEANSRYDSNRHYVIRTSNNHNRTSRHRFSNASAVEGLNLGFRELIFGKSCDLFNGDRKDLLSSRQKSVRFSYAKNNFPDLVDESSELYKNNRPLRHGLRDRYAEEDYYNHSRKEGTENWLKIILENYRSFLSHPSLEELKEKNRISAKAFWAFNKEQMAHIVTIANYMSSDELQAKGKSLEDAALQLQQAVASHDSTFRTDLLFENHEAEVQKIFIKDVLEPAREIAKTFGAIQLPKAHVPYEAAKQTIIDKREEQKRLEELEKEKQRQEIVAQREAARLAREKELEECLDNFMIMLRDSGHGHGHKDREGNEKLWYGTEALAVKDALKLAKKSDRLLKPYQVTLCTEMDQPVHGWFLTSAVDSKKAA